MKKATQNAKKYLQTKIPTSNSSPKPTNSSQWGNISIKGFRKNIASFCCSVQFSSVAQLCLTLWDLMDRSMPSFPVHHQSLELTQAHVHWVSDASNQLILCHPLLLLPSIFPSIRVFSKESVFCIRWTKCWSFSISPSNEYSGLISFRINWLDLLAFQGTLKSLLQYHSSKAAVPGCSAFLLVVLLHPYMTTEKTITLTRRAFFSSTVSGF